MNLPPLPEPYGIIGFFDVYTANQMHEYAQQALAQPAASGEPVAQFSPVTVLPDGSAFATASFPLPKGHWLTAPRGEWDNERDEYAECPAPILTHANRDAVQAAVRYAVRGATMCGQDADFDPDALVLNAIYALCGPFGGAIAQPAPARVPTEWVPVIERLPKSGVTVLACYRNSAGNLRRIRAEWVAARTQESGGESDIGVYDEETDTTYDPEGWYEQIDNWDDGFSAIGVHQGEVTHWMPLPAAPDAQKGAA